MFRPLTSLHLNSLHNPSLMGMARNEPWTSQRRNPMIGSRWPREKSVGKERSRMTENARPTQKRLETNGAFMKGKSVTILGKACRIHPSMTGFASWMASIEGCIAACYSLKMHKGYERPSKSGFLRLTYLNSSKFAVRPSPWLAGGIKMP